MCVRAGKAHITSAYSCAETVAALYYGIMRHDPQNPRWPNRDRFIMSKNHGCLISYPMLADLGYFPEAELDTFMGDGSRLGGHSYNTLDGVEYSGGSLGIGLGVGAGLAYAAKMDREDWLTFVIIGDGECYEGSIWEAAMFAAHNRLDNLVTILDRNMLACTDTTENMLRQEPVKGKWEAFGWETRVAADGHDIAQICGALEDVRGRRCGRPLLLIANTVKGKGLGAMENDPFSHGVAPSGAYIDMAFEALEHEERENQA
jgi:transketolase